ncbi:hypothetical protein ACHQM5_026327 [Ranunculus cassubicifolius]
MALSVNLKTFFPVILLLAYTVCCCQSDDDGGYYDLTRGGYYDPTRIISKALVCFNNNYIYKHCDESFRLTQSGNINVSPEETDRFCYGACLDESNLVLKCIDNIFSNFVFYNRATTRAVRDTIRAGCSHGYERGNFDVSEHLESHAWKVVQSGYMFLVILLGCYLLIWN